MDFERFKLNVKLDNMKRGDDIQLGNCTYTKIGVDKFKNVVSGLVRNRSELILMYSK